MVFRYYVESAPPAELYEGFEGFPDAGKSYQMKLLALPYHSFIKALNQLYRENRYLFPHFAKPQSKLGQSHWCRMRLGSVHSLRVNCSPMIFADARPPKQTPLGFNVVRHPLLILRTVE